MRYLKFEDLPVWKDAAEVTRVMLEFTSVEVFRPHPGLRNRLEGAALSMSNIAEGFERETTNELLAFLYVARGSAGEVRSMLRILETWSLFDGYKSRLADLIVRCEKISKQLYGWIEQLKTSGMRGQRHLQKQTKTPIIPTKQDEHGKDLRLSPAKSEKN